MSCSRRQQYPIVRDAITELAILCEYDARQRECGAVVLLDGPQHPAVRFEIMPQSRTNATDEALEFDAKRRKMPATLRQ